MRNLRLCALLTLIVFLGTAPAAADDAKPAEKRVLEPGRWYPSLEGGLLLSQNSYSTNWHGGDKGAISWTATLNGALENQVKPKANWLSTLKLAYGQTHQQAVRQVDGKPDPSGERIWNSPEKSNDLIDLESILRLTLGGYVDPFASVRFESQFQDLSDPLGRGLTFNPLKFRESAGIARKFVDRPDHALLSRLGFTFRQSARRVFIDDAVDTATGRLSDETESQSTNDGGFELTNDYKTKLAGGRIAWTGKLGFYQPVFYSGDDEFDRLSEAELAGPDEGERALPEDIADFVKMVDVDWENEFSSQLTRLISVKLYVRWVYDKYDNSVLPVLGDDGNLENREAVRTAVRQAGQFKQTLALGLTYRFI